MFTSNQTLPLQMESSVKKQPEEEYYLFAGRVEALKGIDIAVKAFEKLRIRFFMLQEQDR